MKRFCDIYLGLLIVKNWLLMATNAREVKSLEFPTFVREEWCCLEGNIECHIASSILGDVVTSKGGVTVCVFYSDFV